MQFLKTLFWVAVAVILVLFGNANWHDVTLNLWGGLQADVKLPFLVLAAFLLGFLPMLVVHRARLWTLRRRLEALERQAQASAFATPVPAPAVEPVPAPPAPPRSDEDRIATDSKLWPAP
jgi:lipopolysaccharide assembly protein A